MYKETENKAPTPGPSPGQGMAGSWWLGEGSRCIWRDTPASWTEGKGGTLLLFLGSWGGGFVMRRKAPPLKTGLHGEREPDLGESLSWAFLRPEMPPGLEPPPLSPPGTLFFNQICPDDHCLPGTRWHWGCGVNRTRRRADTDLGNHQINTVIHALAPRGEHVPDCGSQ